MCMLNQQLVHWNSEFEKVQGMLFRGNKLSILCPKFKSLLYLLTCRFKKKITKESWKGTIEKEKYFTNMETILKHILNTILLLWLYEIYLYSERMRMDI